MNSNAEIKESLRHMLLPISLESEEDCINEIIEILRSSNVQINQGAAYIKLEYENWRSGKPLDPILKKIILKVITTGNPTSGAELSGSYIDILTNLVKKSGLTFDTSVLILSHLRLILHLAAEEKMSSAKITKVLQAIDDRLNRISWRQLLVILRGIRTLPELNQDEVNVLHSEDEDFEASYFADADYAESAYQVGIIAQKLQFSYDAEDLLNKLSSRGNTHIPYLQILHYQCVIGGFFDHVYSTMYEFSPRGSIATSIFSKWDGLLHTSNPVLNNAKAVDVLDENWVRSRSTNEIVQAGALVDFLKGMDRMGFAAAQELASWIRRWLLRYIKIETVNPTLIPEDLTVNQITTLFKDIADNPTNTFGVLEQRFVDTCSSSIYLRENGWRPRGLGDSVNSNNLSKKKLGDCDFQNVSELKIIAYEAHGGILSKIYFEGHIRTLKRSLDVRRLELEGIADLSDWKIQVVFVAYGFESNLPTKINIDGFEIKMEYITFRALISNINIDSVSFENKVKDYFTGVLNNRRTPEIVRQKVISLLQVSD